MTTIPTIHLIYKTIIIMKKYKLTIIVDENYVTDSLHEIATDIENGDDEVIDYSNTRGSHYSIGEIVELSIQ